MIRYKFLIFAGAMLFLASCNSEVEQNSIDENSDLITVSKQQFESEKMVLGKMSKQQFAEQINVNGIIVSKPEGKAKVGFPMEGRISKILITPGQMVSKGQPLAEISGNAVIELQNEYVASAAGLKRIESEFKRVEALYADKVVAEKEFFAAESEFKIAKADYTALALKLNNVGLSPAQTELGNFVSSYVVKAPIAGRISDVMVHVGQSVDSDVELAEIVNPDFFQLKLSIFEGDMYNVKPGEKVNFKISGVESYYHAEISNVGNQLGIDSKAITCYADIEAGVANLYENSYVDAQIVTAVDSVFALPIEALIKSGEHFNILELVKTDEENYYFQPILIKVGREDNGFREVMITQPLKNILINGAYNFVLE